MLYGRMQMLGQSNVLLNIYIIVAVTNLSTQVGDG